MTALLYFARRCAATARALRHVADFLAITACGGVGALLAWLLVAALGWTGVGGAIAAAVTGMLAATLLWAVGVALLRGLGLLK